MATLPDVEVSSLATRSEKKLLLSIAVDMRLLTMMIAKEFGIEDDLQDLRNEVSRQGGTTESDI